MTTAARPTFEPARGGRGKGEGSGDLSALSKQYSSRDLPGHTKIKYRQSTQDNVDEVRGRDFRRELEERERVTGRDRSRAPREHITSSSSSKRPRIDQIPAANIDADDPIESDEDEDASDKDSDDDEDDTAALLAELSKIKKERAEEQSKREREQKSEEEKIRTENILSGNPLMNLTGAEGFKVKRRWDDDVVFKNCAKGVDETKNEKQFVNDTLRSEFHKKFMDKYIH
ncbi:spliceosome-associated protein CWC15 homolog [Petromyzon marinus]|uniref:Spliceosome-associated protein CWC15 homolog n=2 Tax=Petromyzon marinus TaxID=7757 RepID=A0AAJ7TCN4_PETMA|nr:spliceosome-associated protein CWC15 homolog [Petromyzon marinus]XP_032814233.1 spliceosome-associated protein CWC15 homolog [Petromyzon marinus]